MRSALWTFHARDDVGASASRPNEFVVEGTEIDLLFSLPGIRFGDARTEFIFDDNAQEPTIAGVNRCNLELRNGRDFAQVLALLVAEVSLLADGNLPHFPAARRRDLESRRRGIAFRLHPANDLFGIDIDRISFHFLRFPRDGFRARQGSDRLRRRFKWPRPSALCVYSWSCLSSQTSETALDPKRQDPRRLPVGPESPPGCSDRKATGPPPCFAGRLVHRLSRFAPVDVSLPYFANLASARRRTHMSACVGHAR